MSTATAEPAPAPAPAVDDTRFGADGLRVKLFEAPIVNGGIAATLLHSSKEAQIVSVVAHIVEVDCGGTVTYTEAPGLRNGMWPLPAGTAVGSVHRITLTIKRARQLILMDRGGAPIVTPFEVRAMKPHIGVTFVVVLELTKSKITWGVYANEAHALAAGAAITQVRRRRKK